MSTTPLITPQSDDTQKSDEQSRVTDTDPDISSDPMWSHGTDSGYPSQDPVFVLNPHPLLSRVRNQSIIIKEFRGPRSVTGRVDPTRETRPFVVVVFRFGKDKTTVGESG